MEVTKSHKYLLPIFTAKNNPIIKKLKPITKKVIKVGLWDSNTEYIPYSVYFLFHIKKLNQGQFFRINKAIKCEESYINDYLYGDYLNDFLHMFVIKCPDEVAYNRFLASEYSKMFNDKEAHIIYPKQTSKVLGFINEARGVVTKDKAVKEKLENKLLTSIPDENELDSKLNFEHEIFNWIDNIKLPFL